MAIYDPKNSFHNHESPDGPFVTHNHVSPIHGRTVRCDCNHPKQICYIWHHKEPKYKARLIFMQLHLNTEEHARAVAELELVPIPE